MKNWTAAWVTGSVSCVLLFLSMGCGEEGPTITDGVPPATVVDLRAEFRSDDVVVLRWTAPGDDGDEGRASLYDIRYSGDDPNLTEWWDSYAEAIESPPAPAPPGAPEEVTVSGLTVGVEYAFRLRTIDEAQNESALSNIARVEILPPEPPSVTDLTFDGSTSSWADLSWTSPTIDGRVPVAYEVRWSLSPLTEDNWAAAELLPDVPAPSTPGVRENYRWTSVQASRTYNVGVRTRDADGTLSDLENVVLVRTPEIQVEIDGTPQLFPDLAAAVAAAGEGDVITLGNGIFNGEKSREILVEDRSITIRSESGNPEECRIDLEDAGWGLVFRHTQGGAKSPPVVQSITIENGHAGEGNLFGGAVSSFGTGTTFIDCVFRSNTSDGSGGAIVFNNEADGFLDRCVFIDNGASGRGGAIRIDSESNPRILDCRFEGNVAGTTGGAIAVREGGDPRLERCFFFNNSAETYAGALSFETARGDVIECIFDGNVAGAGGGAVLCFEEADPSFDSCVFERNEATTWGGAVYCWVAASPTFSNCVLAENTAAEGGAVLSWTRSLPYMQRCTIVANAAEFGAGLRSIGLNSGFVVERSIIAFSTEGASIHCQDGAAFDLNCTAVYGNAGGDFVSCIVGQADEDANLWADPDFCNLAGGDYRLRTTSPCANRTGCGKLGAAAIGCAP